MRRPDWWPGHRAARPGLLIAPGRVELRAGDAPPAASEPFDGLGTLAAAIAQLLRAAPGPGGPLRVRVGVGYARMVLVPFVPQLTTAARWQTYAASRLEQIHGEAAADWVLRVAPELPPRARLAVALPRALIDAVHAGCGDHGVDSLRVALLDQVGALLAGERRFSGCIVDVDAAAATLLVMVQGELRRIRTRHFDALDELVATVRAEWSAFGIAAAAVNAAVALPAALQDAFGAPLAAALGTQRIATLPP